MYYISALSSYGKKNSVLFYILYRNVKVLKWFAAESYSMLRQFYGNNKYKEIVKDWSIQILLFWITIKTFIDWYICQGCSAV